jgi:hypothetical protein
LARDRGGTLTLKLGPANEKSFTLRHFDGHVFVYHPYEGMPQLPVAATFAIGSDNRATRLTPDDLNDNGQGRLARARSQALDVGPGTRLNVSVRLMRHAWVTSISKTGARTDVLR